MPVAAAEQPMHMPDPDDARGQLVLQQTPSTQAPLAQSVFPPQEAPVPFLLTQELPEQEYPSAQSFAEVAAVQLVRQALVEPQVNPPGHGSVAPETQVPAPLQPAALVSMFLLPHVAAAPQGVPEGASVGVGHPLAATQLPATLQVGALQVTGLAPTQVPPWQDEVMVHLLPSSHEVPLVAGMQVPLAILQAEHPVHAPPLFCQAPLESQVCGCAPLQVFAPGIHEPVQVPLVLLQTFLHVDPLFCQVPLESHI